MAIIYLNGIEKCFATDVILKNISFKIEEGEKVGLVGVNGAGKSTIFRILTGENTPDSGEVYIDRAKTLACLSQNLDLNMDNSVFEETMTVFSEIKSIEIKLKELEVKMADPLILNNEKLHKNILEEYGHLQESYEKLDGYSCESFARGFLKGLGIQEEDFEKKVKILSGGQKTRIAMAKLLLSKPDILLLDEPTNHLDLKALSFLEEYLKGIKSTVIVISHDRYFLDEVTSRTLELTDGIIEEYCGNYSYFISEREKRLKDRVKAFEEQQREIDRLEEMIERYRSFNREKSIKQAESKEKMLLRIDRLDRPNTDDVRAKIDFKVDLRSGNDVIYSEDVSKSFGNNKILDNISFQIRRGERTALIGENGKGKSTLFKIIIGQLPMDSGYLKIGRNVKVGYLDQEMESLSLEKTVLDEIWDEFPDLTISSIRGALGRFLFTKDSVFKKVGDLSGGEKLRLSLLKIMLKKPNLLLLDEPTNHLDIISREELEKSLLSYEGTLFVISHDRYFLNKTITRILELEDGKFNDFPGNYSYYLQKKNAKEEEIIISTTGKTKTEIKEERKKLKEEVKRKKEKELLIKNTELEIEKTEGRIEEIKEEMCSSEVYSNPEKMAQLSKEIKELEEKLNSLYEEWEELL